MDCVPPLCLSSKPGLVHVARAARCSALCVIIVSLAIPTPASVVALPAACIVWSIKKRDLGSEPRTVFRASIARARCLALVAQILCAITIIALPVSAIAIRHSKDLHAARIENRVFARGVAGLGSGYIATRQLPSGGNHTTTSNFDNAETLCRIPDGSFYTVSLAGQPIDRIEQCVLWMECPRGFEQSYYCRIAEACETCETVFQATHYLLNLGTPLAAVVFVLDWLLLWRICALHGRATGTVLPSDWNRRNGGGGGVALQARQQPTRVSTRRRRQPSRACPCTGAHLQTARCQCSLRQKPRLAAGPAASDAGSAWLGLAPK